MFHLEQEKDAELLTEINKGTESVTNIDYKKVYDIVTKGNSTGSFRPDMSVKSQIKIAFQPHENTMKELWINLLQQCK